MEQTLHGICECSIKGSKILSLALCSIAFFVLTLLFPVGSEPIGRILTYGVYTLSGMGMIAVLGTLHLKYVRQMPWAVVTNNALKWFVPMKMDYATIDFAAVESFRVVNVMGVAVLYARCRDGRDTATGISSAFLSRRDIEKLLREAAARIGRFSSQG